MLCEATGRSSWKKIAAPEEGSETILFFSFLKVRITVYTVAWQRRI
jgi:hypothetical protein